VIHPHDFTRPWRSRARGPQCRRLLLLAGEQPPTATIRGLAAPAGGYAATSHRGRRAPRSPGIVAARVETEGQDRRAPSSPKSSRPSGCHRGRKATRIEAAGHQLETRTSAARSSRSQGSWASWQPRPAAGASGASDWMGPSRRWRRHLAARPRRVEWQEYRVRSQTLVPGVERAVGGCGRGQGVRYT
jgi:hypothetical protein